MYSFSNLEPVRYSMSHSNCCFLTCIQISQEAGQVVWYSHLFKNFPVCCDPHKGFGIDNKSEVDVFLELSCFFDDPANLENSAVATGLEKVSFYSNPKERQCQRMLKLPHNCAHLICLQSKAQNSPSQDSRVCEP